MEILGEHIDKKHLLYIGGAVASIAALIWIMRRSQSSQSAGVIQPARPSGGATGGTSDQLEAARLSSATALAIEQGRENVAIQQIQSAEKIALGSQYTAMQVAGMQATSRNIGALAPGISAAGMYGSKTVFDMLKEAFDKLLNPSGTDTVGSPVYGGTIGNEPYGPPLPPGYEYPGGIIDVGGGTIYDQPIGPNLPTDEGYFTTTGGGSSVYFGGGSLPSGEDFGGGIM